MIRLFISTIINFLLPGFGLLLYGRFLACFGWAVSSCLLGPLVIPGSIIHTFLAYLDSRGE